LIFATSAATLAAQWAGAIAPVVAGLSPSMAMAQEKRVAKVHDLTPQQVAQGLAEGRMVLVDVREFDEIAAEAYPDAIALPLSRFDARQIPDPQGKQVVFACRSGKRSVTASLAAQAAGLNYDSHLAGGIIDWKAAGLPTKSGR
jgi:rhodanese-related sulfurtransferase